MQKEESGETVSKGVLNDVHCVLHRCTPTASAIGLVEGLAMPPSTPLSPYPLDATLISYTERERVASDISINTFLILNPSPLIPYLSLSSSLH